MTPYLLGLLAGVVCAAVAQALLPATRIPALLRAPGGDKARAGHGLWVGLAAATLAMALWQAASRSAEGYVFGAGPALALLALAAAPLVATALASDLRRPSSERHAAGLLLSGLALSFSGFSIFVLSAPGGQTVGVPAAWQAVLTIAWLFLMVSIVELVSLVPMALPALVIAMSAAPLLGGGLHHSLAASALAGLIPGAVAGRLGADALRGRSRAWGKTEVLALGLWLTAMTNASFLKSVALAGFVLPLGVVAVGAILLSLRAFERSLILRATPRAGKR